MEKKGIYTVNGSGEDCKSSVSDSGGSNPSMPTIFKHTGMWPTW